MPVRALHLGAAARRQTNDKRSPGDDPRRRTPTGSSSRTARGSPASIAISDIPKTVDALEEGREPPIEWRRERASPERPRLDERLSDARDAQIPATVALTLALPRARGRGARHALGAGRAQRAALPARRDRARAARERARARRPVETTIVVLLGVPLAYAVARWVPLTLAVPVFLGPYGLVLALSPETNSLMAIGPHPWSGGRFYGVTNMIETLLLGPALAAGALVRGWRSSRSRCSRSSSSARARRAPTAAGSSSSRPASRCCGCCSTDGRARFRGRSPRSCSSARVRRDRRARGRVEPRRRRRLGGPRAPVRRSARAGRALGLDRDLERLAAGRAARRPGRARVLRHARPRFPSSTPSSSRSRSPRRQRLSDEGRRVRSARLRGASRLVGFEEPRRRNRIRVVKRAVLFIVALASSFWASPPAAAARRRRPRRRRSRARSRRRRAARRPRATRPRARRSSRPRAAAAATRSRRRARTAASARTSTTPTSASTRRSRRSRTAAAGCRRSRIA